MNPYQSSNAKPLAVEPNWSRMETVAFFAYVFSGIASAGLNMLHIVSEEKHWFWLSISLFVGVALPAFFVLIKARKERKRQQ